ncbi:dihydroneopterin aldolase [Sulfuriferula sp. AH1]|uniref:dihydroneopterin aldolase n=1 Tax=Sulfuriferula sp. AH1 TaxID=1985873 RepID=UPI000B3B9161|nr:dihydroneopterin aldolase [Sulfuriferula sp. AH1]ARU30658.1 dihydroneopterin aldolase [Sulfuriferula sp. AH1]
MDTLFLRDFRLQMIIGIYEWERKVPQTVQLDLEIGLPHSRACQTDDVADSINYADVAQRIRDTVAQRNFNLVEALAEHVAQVILTEFGSPWVKVCVTKLAVVRGIKQLGICIERGQKA